MTAAGVVRGEWGDPVIADAVVVIPGVMGSELVDSDGVVRWGLQPAVLAKAWLRGSAPELDVTEADRAGGGRLRPTRLLRVPAYAPVFGGIEPYTALLERVVATAVDARAVVEFPYDWRLSIEFNAGELVRRCAAHLDQWRQVVRSEGYADPAELRVVIVAHSMGGLVARYASEVLGLSTVLRRIITLGTPYFGSVKTVQLLVTGRGAPLPRRAAWRLARTCPGVYDLLPRYRCVVDGSGGLRHLVSNDLLSDDVEAELAGEADHRWRRLGLGAAVGAPTTPISALVGAEQPTLQSVVIDSGEFGFLHSLAGTNYGGDSTVYRQAAAPVGIDAFPLPQRHGALAKSPEALAFVADKLIGADTSPPLGTRPVGADIPDLVAAGSPVTITVTGTAGDPVGVSVRSVDLETGVPTTWLDGKPADETVLFTGPGLRQGLHRIEVTAGGYSAITEVTLAEGT